MRSLAPCVPFTCNWGQKKDMFESMYTDNLFPSIYIYIVVSLYQDMYIYPHTHVDIVDLIKDQLVGLLLLDGADRVFVPLKKEEDSEPLASYAFLALCWVM